MRIILLSIAIGLLVSACGTKGPLYIPEQRYPQNQKNEPNPAPAQAAQPSIPAENSAPEDNPEISK